jgi:hypothetical protein
MDFRKAAQNPCRNRHDTCQIKDPSRSQRFLIASKATLHRSLKLPFGDEKWVATEVLEGRRLWLNLCDRHVSFWVA